MQITQNFRSFITTLKGNARREMGMPALILFGTMSQSFMEIVKVVFELRA